MFYPVIISTYIHDLTTQVLTLGRKWLHPQKHSDIISNLQKHSLLRQVSEQELNYPQRQVVGKQQTPLELPPAQNSLICYLVLPGFPKLNMNGHKFIRQFHYISKINKKSFRVALLKYEFNCKDDNIHKKRSSKIINRHLEGL